MFMFKYPFDTNFFTMAIDTAVNSVKNPYRSLLDSNPRGLFSRGTDKRNRQLQAETAAAEFDADLALQDYNNEYNSPTAKAERMRAAGLNPDLAGIDGVSDSSGLSGLSGSAQLSPDASPLETANFWLSNSQNILSSAMQFAQQMESMRSTSLDNDIKNIDYVKALQSLKDDSSSSIFFGNFKNPDETFDSSLFTSGLSKRNQKRLRKLLPSSDAYTRYNKRVNDYASSAISAGESLALGSLRGNGFFDPSDMAKGYQDVAEFLEKVQKYSASADAYQEKYRSDYYEHSSGSLDASIDSENNQINLNTNRDNYASSKGNKEIDKSFSELVSKLRSNDNWWSDAILMVLYAMKSGAFTGAANFFGKVFPQQKPTSKTRR